jgi:ATP-dependent RNA helicase SUPV3L1/SUV3
VALDALELSFEEGFANPVLRLGGAPCANVLKGNTRLAPQVRLIASSPLSVDEAKKNLAACEAWFNSELESHLGPLLRLNADLAGAAAGMDEAPLSGLARGIAFRLAEHLGVLPRLTVERELRQVDQEARRGLRRHRICIGASNLFIPILLKPAATRLRLMLWALWEGCERLPGEPAAGMVWTPMAKGVPQDFYRVAGFHPANTKAVRVDMVERLADAVRPLGESNVEFEVSPDIMGLVGLSGTDFAAVMKAIGYKARGLPLEEKADEAAETPPQEPVTAAPRHLFRWSQGSRRKVKKAESQAGRKRAKKGAKTAGGAKPPDPDSPFASLAGLKKMLEKGEK